MRIFITGGAGVGKSHLVKTITQFANKAFNLFVGSPDKLKVLALAPTGVAAINVNGNTIHTGLAINPNDRAATPTCLSDMKRSYLRNLYSEVEVVIIDEISMVSNHVLLNIHLRLCEIFGYNESVLFGNKTIIVVGDLLQLPPVRAAYVFKPINMNFNNINLWSHFQMCELTEVMRQKGDLQFIPILNNIRIGKIDFKDIKLLEQQKISLHQLDEKHFENATVLFAENSLKDLYNGKRLKAIPHPIISVKAIDKMPQDMPEHLRFLLTEKSPSQTGGLSYELTLKKMQE